MNTPVIHFWSGSAGIFNSVFNNLKELVNNDGILKSVFCFPESTQSTQSDNAGNPEVSLSPEEEKMYIRINKNHEVEIVELNKNEKQLASVNAGSSNSSKEEIPGTDKDVFPENLCFYLPLNQQPEIIAGNTTQFLAFLKVRSNYDQKLNLHIILDHAEGKMKRSKKKNTLFDDITPYNVQNLTSHFGKKILKPISNELIDYIDDRSNNLKVSFSVGFDDVKYPSSIGMDNMELAVFLFYLLELFSLKNLQTECLERIKMASILPGFKADLQILILGDFLKEKLFETIKRNIVERWNIRYGNLQTRKIQINPVEDLDENEKITIAIQDGKRKNPFSYLAIGCVLYSENKFEIAKHIGAHDKLVITWIINEADLNIQADSDLFTNHLYSEFITISEVLDAMKAYNESSEPELYIFVSCEKTLYHGASPWVEIKAENKLVSEDALKRRSPLLHHLVKTNIKNIRIQYLPYNTNGSHLDFAPLWIDKFIFHYLNI